MFFQNPGKYNSATMKMEATGSSEMLQFFYPKDGDNTSVSTRPHGVTSQRTVIFIVTAVRTSKLTQYAMSVKYYNISESSRFDTN
jgi:hypothetical protein